MNDMLHIVSYPGLDTVVVENRTVGILFNTGRSKTMAVFSRYFPVFLKIEFRYFVLLFLGIPRIDLMAVEVSELSRCFTIILRIASA